MRKYSSIILLILSMMMVSCGVTPSQTAEKQHEESIIVTEYSDKFELFAEATPFVVGKASVILAHFTHLENFKPLEAGSVTISLTIGSSTVSQTIEKPIHPGIYKFDLTPQASGEGQIVFSITTPEGSAHIMSSSVTAYADEHQADEAAEKLEITNSNSIKFTKEQSWKTDFATEAAITEPFGQTIKVAAQIMPSQGDEKVIVARTNGIVTFLDENITDGKAVTSGQRLFSVDASGLADNNLDVRFKEAATEYARAQSEYSRKEELRKDKIVSETDFQKAKADYLNAQATYQQLRQSFSSGRQTAVSPIAGFVKQIMVRNGEYAQAGQSIISVAQNINLLIKAEIQPKYYPTLSTITTANIRLLDSDITYSLADLDGKLVSYGRSTDLDNPLIPVIFQVRNSISLLSGSFVEMYIKTQSTTHAITVPRGAIIEEMGNYFVFVQLTPELFEKRAIKMGATDGLRTQITNGISPDERVVSKGAMMVKLTQSSGTLDAHSGHAH